ncbi:hypothetical protein BDB01DRAFT_847730 [Pilobolus umbonatus]|nr:hypothetical protein BDB01DRAFT_847730 [Pilobolus umbonatus]
MSLGDPGASKVFPREMYELINHPVTPSIISHLVYQSSLVVPCQKDQRIKLPSLYKFVKSIVRKSSVQSGTLLAALVFLERLKNTLSMVAQGRACTIHRIFLACLIVTSKAIHDTSPKNKHWAGYASHFDVAEVNLMEKQVLFLLKYQIIIHPTELVLVFYNFKQSIAPIVSFNMRQYRQPVNAPEVVEEICYSNVLLDDTVEHRRLSGLEYMEFMEPHSLY